MTNNNQSGEVERLTDWLFDTEYMTGKQPNLTKENIRQTLTTHGASEYARGKGEELNRIRHIALTMGDCPVNDPMADAGWMHFQSKLVQALSQENTLKE